MTSLDHYPRISVVTPSLNRARYLEEAMRSVLVQGYRNLEYIVVDGGSTDGSVGIIRRHENNLSFWVSEPDGGQYDAINKGFSKTTGDIMGWLNSDDKYFSWTFDLVSHIFSKFAEIEWISTLNQIWWDEFGKPVGCGHVDGFDRKGFFRGDHLPREGCYTNGWIQQESTFWRRSLWERAGGYIDGSLKLAGDFELWARFFKYAELYGVDVPLGGFRWHGDQKAYGKLKEYVAEGTSILENGGGRLCGRVESRLRWAVRRCLPVRITKLFGLRSSYRFCRYLGPRKGWQIIEG